MFAVLIMFAVLTIYISYIYAHKIGLSPHPTGKIHIHEDFGRSFWIIYCGLEDLRNLLTGTKGGNCYTDWCFNSNASPNFTHVKINDLLSKSKLSWKPGDNKTLGSGLESSFSLYKVRIDDTRHHWYVNSISSPTSSRATAAVSTSPSAVMSAFFSSSFERSTDRVRRIAGQLESTSVYFIRKKRHTHPYSA